MATKSVMDEIVNSLAFVVEATPQDNAKQLANKSNITPLNLKVRVRKKTECGIKHGVISIPKNSSNEGPERIRLISSDQTIMSFNVLMEADMVKKPKRKRRHFFGGCLGTHYKDDDDDDNDSYVPETENTLEPLSRSEVVLKENFPLSKPKYGDESPPSFKKHSILGKCKPGGCLDPPFSEERYSYEPVGKKKQNTNNQVVTADDGGQNKEAIRGSKPKVKEIDRNSILSLYEADPLKGSVDNKYSDSIITYPPETSSSINFYDQYTKNKTLIDENRRKSYNESTDTFFSPSRKTHQRKKSSDNDQPNDIIINGTNTTKSTDDKIYDVPIRKSVIKQDSGRKVENYIEDASSPNYAKDTAKIPTTCVQSNNNGFKILPIYDRRSEKNKVYDGDKTALRLESPNEAALTLIEDVSGIYPSNNSHSEKVNFISSKNSADFDSDSQKSMIHDIDLTSGINISSHIVENASIKPLITILRSNIHDEDEDSFDQNEPIQAELSQSRLITGKLVNVSNTPLAKTKTNGPNKIEKKIGDQNEELNIPEGNSTEFVREAELIFNSRHSLVSHGSASNIKLKYSHKQTSSTLLIDPAYDRDINTTNANENMNQREIPQIGITEVFVEVVKDTLPANFTKNSASTVNLNIIKNAGEDLANVSKTNKKKLFSFKPDKLRSSSKNDQFKYQTNIHDEGSGMIDKNVIEELPRQESGFKYTPNLQMESSNVKTPQSQNNTTYSSQKPTNIHSEKIALGSGAGAVGVGAASLIVEKINSQKHIKKSKIIDEQALEKDSKDVSISKDNAQSLKINGIDSNIPQKETNEDESQYLSQNLFDEKDKNQPEKMSGRAQNTLLIQSDSEVRKAADLLTYQDQYSRQKLYDGRDKNKLPLKVLAGQAADALPVQSDRKGADLVTHPDQYSRQKLNENRDHKKPPLESFVGQTTDKLPVQSDLQVRRVADLVTHPDKYSRQNVYEGRDNNKPPLGSLAGQATDQTDLQVRKGSLVTHPDQYPRQNLHDVRDKNKRPKETLIGQGANKFPDLQVRKGADLVTHTDQYSKQTLHDGKNKNKTIETLSIQAAGKEVDLGTHPNINKSLHERAPGQASDSSPVRLDSNVYKNVDDLTTHPERYSTQSTFEVNDRNPLPPESFEGQATDTIPDEIDTPFYKNAALITYSDNSEQKLYNGRIDNKPSLKSLPSQAPDTLSILIDSRVHTDSALGTYPQGHSRQNLHDGKDKNKPTFEGLSGQTSDTLSVQIDSRFHKGTALVTHHERHIRQNLHDRYDNRKSSLERVSKQASDTLSDQIDSRVHKGSILVNSTDRDSQQNVHDRKDKNKPSLEGLSGLASDVLSVQIDSQVHKSAVLVAYPERHSRQNLHDGKDRNKPTLEGLSGQASDTLCVQIDSRVHKGVDLLTHPDGAILSQNSIHISKTSSKIINPGNTANTIIISSKEHIDILLQVDNNEPPSLTQSSILDQSNEESDKFNYKYTSDKINRNADNDTYQKLQLKQELVDTDSAEDSPRYKKDYISDIHANSVQNIRSITDNDHSASTPVTDDSKLFSYDTNEPAMINSLLKDFKDSVSTYGNEETLGKETFDSKLQRLNKDKQYMITNNYHNADDVTIVGANNQWDSSKNIIHKSSSHNDQNNLSDASIISTEKTKTLFSPTTSFESSTNSKKSVTNADGTMPSKVDDHQPSLLSGQHKSENSISNVYDTKTSYTDRKRLLRNISNVDLDSTNLGENIRNGFNVENYGSYENTKLNKTADGLYDFDSKLTMLKNPINLANSLIDNNISGDDTSKIRNMPYYSNYTMSPDTESKQYKSSNVSSRSSLKKDTVTLNIGFQSYINDRKDRVIRSIDTAKEHHQNPDDMVTVIKTQIRPCVNEMRIPIDNEHDMTIQIKRTRSPLRVHIADDKQSETEKLFQKDKNLSSIPEFSRTLKKTAEAPPQRIVGPIEMQNLLNTIYEKDLIPLQQAIVYLKKEVDTLYIKRMALLDQSRSVNRVKSVRTIRVNPRCCCSKK